MDKRQVVRVDEKAQDLVEQWINGNRKDVAKALRRNGRLALRFIEKLRGQESNANWLQSQDTLDRLLDS